MNHAGIITGMCQSVQHEYDDYKHGVMKKVQGGRKRKRKYFHYGDAIEKNKTTNPHFN